MANIKEQNILIVDDLKENLLSLSAVLLKEGFKVVTAQSAQIALKHLQKEKFGLILLDVRMPEMDGFELAEVLKSNSNTENIPIIFVTAEADHIEHRIKGYEIGALDYISKPLNTELLLIKINNLLELYSSASQLTEENENLTRQSIDSNLNFETLFYSSPDEVFIIDENGYIKKINRYGKLSMGPYAAELIGKNIKELPFHLNITNQGNAFQLFDSVMTNGIKGNITNAELITKTGQKIFYAITGNIFHNSSLERFLQINVRNTTQTREAEEKLKQSQERFQLAVEGTNDAIWDCDLVTGVNYYSPRFFDFIGYENNAFEVTDDVLKKLIHPDDRDKTLQFIQNFIQTNQDHYKVEFRILHKNGSYQNILSRGKAIKDVSGKTIRVIGTHVNITEQRKNENFIKKLNEGFNVKTGSSYFSEFCNFCCSNFNVKYAFVGKYIPDENSIETIAFCIDEEPQANFKYNLTNTPCELVIAKDTCFYPKNVKELFPLDEDLKKLNAQSYFGKTIIDEHKNVLGILVLLDENPITEFDSMDRILSLMVARTSNEINRHNAEIELKASEEKYRLMLETTNEMVGILSNTGKIAWVNRSWKEQMGYSEDEVIGKSIECFIDEDNKEQFSLDFSKITSKENIKIKRCLITKKGEKIIIEGTAIPLIENGVFKGVQGFYSNVTERIEAENKLIESNRRFNEAQKVAKIGSWELDLITNTLSWSDELYRIFDIDKNQFGASYEAFLDIIHPDDREMVNFAYTNSLITKQPYRITHRLKYKDGTVKYVEEQCETFYDETGKALKSIGNAQDITEKRLAEEKLRISEERFNLAMQGANDGLWDWNVEDDTVYFSPRYKSMLGYSEFELQNHNETWDRLLHPEDLNKTRKRLDDFVNGLIPEYVAEFRLKHKNGHYVDILSRGHAIRNIKGKAIRIVGTHVDISERNNVLKELIDKRSFIKGVLDSLTSHIAVIDESGYVIETNSAWNEFSIQNGESDLKRTAVGSNYFDVCEKARASGDIIAGKVIKGIKDVLKNKIPRFQIEYPCFSKGIERWFLLTVTNYLSDVPKVVVRHIDVTERRLADAKMKLDSEILSGITDAIVYSNLRFEVVEWNKNAEDVYGWSKREMKGKAYPEILDFSLLNGKSMKSMMTELLELGRCRAEIRAQTKNKNYIYISANSSLLLSAEGNPIGIVSIQRDITESIAREKALEISKLNYKELFEQSPFGVMTLNTNGYIQAVNNKLVDITGFTKESFIGEHFFKNPFNVNPVNIKIKDVLVKIMEHQGSTYTFEAIGFKKNHQLIHCEVNAKYLQEIEKISLIVKDITEIKQSEIFDKMLYNITTYANSSTVGLNDFGNYLQQQLSSYFKPDAFYITSFTHNLNELEFLYSFQGLDEYKNHVHEAIELIDEVLIQKKEAVLITENELQAHASIELTSLFKKGVHSLLAAPLISGSQTAGAIVALSYKGSESFCKENLEVLTKISGIITPIIEKLKNERQLWLINSAIQSAGDAVFITNAAEKGNPIVFTNKKFSELTGYDYNEIYSKKTSTLFGTKTGKNSQKEINSAFENKTAFHGEILNYKKTGETFWSDLTLNPVKDKNGITTNFIGIQNDITKKKEMERLLIEKNKELELFMYRASHDLRGPLSTSKGLLNFALDECTDENILNYLKLLEKSNIKLDNILSELMEIVLIREGTIERQPVNISNLFNEITDTVSLIDKGTTSIAVSKKVNFDQEVNVDLKLLKIILRNVFNNAVKYSNPLITSPQVNLEASIQQNVLIFTITDNGIGIKNNYLNKVFDMFFRATDSSSGTGLGLYITRNAVEKLNGHISIQSEEKIGTTVKVKIPLL